MASVLRFGSSSRLELDLPAELLLAELPEPRAASLADPATVTARSLAEPLDFPPLRQAVVPGDHVVLAVDATLSQPAAVLTPVVETLAAAGVAPRDVTLLRTAGENGGGPALRSALPSDWSAAVDEIVHDPHARGELSYLASTASGERIYLNRRLCDADLVVPIAAARDARRDDYFGGLAQLYPAFSDAATQHRFRSIALGDAQGTTNSQARRRAREEADEVGWLLGVAFSLEVVPGPGDAILDVVSGTPAAVEQQAAARFAQAWSHPIDRRARLVVATISGPPVQQTWESVGRALSAALQVVAEGGAIALCTEIDHEPGPAVRHLAVSEHRPTALREIARQRLPDALVAAQLARALDRAQIYLLSRLDEETVEQIELVPLEGADQLERLAQRHGSCIVVPSAQHAVPRPGGR